MKTLLIMLVTLTMLVQVAEARKRKPRAGTVNSGIFTDSENAFTVRLPDEWKYKVGKSDSHSRLVLLQKDYSVPDDLQQSPEYTLPPRAEVWLAEIRMTVGEFIDSLLSDSYNSDIKDELQQLVIPADDRLKLENFSTTRKFGFDVDGERAVCWQGTMTYTVSEGAVSGNRSYGIGFLGIKKNENILMILLACELQFIDDIFQTMQDMMSSISWIDKESG